MDFSSHLTWVQHVNTNTSSSWPIQGVPGRKWIFFFRSIPYNGLSKPELFPRGAGPPGRSIPHPALRASRSKLCPQFKIPRSRLTYPLHLLIEPSQPQSLHKPAQKAAAGAVGSQRHQSWKGRPPVVPLTRTQQNADHLNAGVNWRCWMTVAVGVLENLPSNCFR